MVFSVENNGVDSRRWESGCWIVENGSCPLETDITTPMLQMKKLSLKEVEWLVAGELS